MMSQNFPAVPDHLEPCARQLFLDARTPVAWSERPVPANTLQEIYELACLGPTSLNCQPARIVFVTTPEAKDRLRPALMPGNVPKVDAAPVTAIIGYDLAFFEHLPRLFAHADVAPMFRANPALAEATAFRNGSLTGAYLIIAARLLGLDAGPMSGFDNAKVDAAFFPGGNVRSNFLCCIGHAVKPHPFPRAPRFKYSEVCTIV